MDRPWEQLRVRARHLLADRATFGLERVEQHELDELLGEFPTIPSDEMELTAAAVWQATNAPDAADLPATVCATIRRDALRMMEGKKRNVVAKCSQEPPLDPEMEALGE